MHPERFLDDVLGAPGSLRTLAAEYAGGLGVAIGGRRVVFLGMGSSRFAAMTVAAGLRATGVDANAEMASTGSPQPGSTGTLAVAISATGGSEETVAAMRRHAGTSTVVGITNRPGSAIATESDVCLELHAGEEVSGIACRTYQSTLALLHLLAGAQIDSIRAAADASQALLDGRGAWLEEAVELLSGEAVHVLAPAERIGSAEQSALMLREVPRVRGDACETGDWSHVDVYLSKFPGLGLVMLRGSAWEAEVMEWAAERSFPVVTVGGELAGAALNVPLDDGGDPVVRSLVEHHVAELIAASLYVSRKRDESVTVNKGG
jgi:glutamine---fructose-6-phosphate transaminase (isomerizing)